jgi:DNA-binding transcriptional ArsR family regulator
LVTYSRRVTDDDRVFKALADPTRRFLLDRLFARIKATSRTGHGSHPPE